MKTCSNCGAQLPDTASFCNKCGAQCAQSQPQPQPPVKKKRQSYPRFFMDNAGIPTRIFTKIYEVLCLVTIGYGLYYMFYVIYNENGLGYYTVKFEITESTSDIIFFFGSVFLLVTAVVASSTKSIIAQAFSLIGSGVCLGVNIYFLVDFINRVQDYIANDIPDDFASFLVLPIIISVLTVVFTIVAIILNISPHKKYFAELKQKKLAQAQSYPTTNNQLQANQIYK